MSTVQEIDRLNDMLAKGESSLEAIREIRQTALKLHLETHGPELGDGRKIARGKGDTLRIIPARGI